MFIVSRLVIGSIFLGAAVFGISKMSRKRKTSLYILAGVLSIILVTVLALLPFENWFTSFDTPEKAYDYCTAGQSDIQLVVPGIQSDLIVADKNGVNQYLIIPKSEEGWKVGIGANTKRIIHKTHDGISIYVYQYKMTDDYYITVLDTNGGRPTIEDGCNSEFLAIEKTNQAVGNVFVTYYAHISDLDDQYWIRINDVKIEFDD